MDGSESRQSRRHFLGQTLALSALPAVWDQPVRAQGGGVNWVVSVGISNYTEGWQRLNFAANDAQLFAKAIGSAPDQTALLALATPPPDREAILREVRRVAGKAGPEDTLWVYFSGHGYHAGGLSYLIPRGCPLAGLRDRGVSVSDLRAIVDDPAVCKARLRVLVLDACHSGSTKGGPPATWQQVFKDASGTAILAAAQISEPAHELSTLKGGVFTHYLVRALSGDAGPKGKPLTLREMLDFVVRKVQAETSSIQTPFFSLPSEKVGEVQITAKGVPLESLETNHVLSKREGTLPGFVVAIDGKPEEAKIVETRLRKLLLDSGFPLVAADAGGVDPKSVLKLDPEAAAKLTTEKNARFLLRGTVLTKSVMQDEKLANLISATVVLTGELLDFDGQVLDSQDGTELGSAVTRAAGSELLAQNAALLAATESLYKKMRKRARAAFAS